MRCMTKQLSLVSISVLFIVFSVAVISAYSQEEQTRSSLAPEKVLRIGPDQEAINFRAVSKNGKLVLLGREGVESGGMRKSFYEVNGNPDRSYDSVTKPILSSDGNHYMYGARKNNKYWVVVDGKKEEGPYDGLGWGSAGYFEVGTGKFSPVGSGYDVLLGLYDSSSTHYAYMVKISNQWVIVVDGQRIPGSYEDIGLDFSFSPQGNKIAFWGKHRKGWTLFVNGEDIIGTLLKETKWYSFSPDWSQVLLSGRLADKLVIMYADITKQRASRWEIDDVKNPGPRRSPWSKDSSRWALAIKESNKWYILDGGKKINVSGLFVDYPVLSPDGKSLLFSAKTGNEITIYQNYQVLAKWKDLCDLNSGTAYISPEDSPPLLMISSSANRIAYCARDNKNESFLVVDGKKYSAHSMVSIFLFSPTGKRWAAVVQRGESGEEGTREKIVVDGIEGEWESWASIRDIVFDSLRDHIAYSMKTGETRKVLLQQKLLANFSDDAEEVLFEPSGKLCILSKTKEHKYRIWCGGKHGKLWDSVETFSSSIFAIDGYMNYVAHKQGDVYVVRRKISE